MTGRRALGLVELAKRSYAASVNGEAGGQRCGQRDQQRVDVREQRGIRRPVLSGNAGCRGPSERQFGVRVCPSLGSRCRADIPTSSWCHRKPHVARTDRSLELDVPTARSIEQVPGAPLVAGSVVVAAAVVLGTEDQNTLAARRERSSAPRGHRCPSSAKRSSAPHRRGPRRTCVRNSRPWIVALMAIPCTSGIDQSTGVWLQSPSPEPGMSTEATVVDVADVASVVVRLTTVADPTLNSGCCRSNRTKPRRPEPSRPRSIAFVPSDPHPGHR